MSRIAILLAVALLTPAVLAPTAAAQLPDNPFDDFACYGGGGSGLLGYVFAIVGLACGATLFAASTTYAYVCTLSGAC